MDLITDYYPFNILKNTLHPNNPIQNLLLFWIGQILFNQHDIISNS